MTKSIGLEYEKMYGVDLRSQFHVVKKAVPLNSSKSLHERKTSYTMLRRGYYIYVVSLKEHSGIVKVGMTKNWQSRKTAYEKWNLSKTNAIDRVQVFTICEEFVDLAKLERHILDNLDAEKAFGNEWFFADFDDVCRFVDQVMCSSNISYL